MQTVITINAVIMALFFVCYSYQFFYVAVALLKRKKFTCRNENHCIAVLIAARNEENVIGQLLDSIHAQKNYPMDHVDIYVGADNCTDDTARVARERGAIALSATIRCMSARAMCSMKCSSASSARAASTTMPISCWTPTISSTRTSSPRSRRSTPAAMRS